MEMIDATRQPCPVCDSPNVRWRGRRLHDVPLTWLRYVGEIVGAALGGPGTNSVRGRYTGSQAREELRGEILEARTGLKTPTRFWRCQDCRNRGAIFADGPNRSRAEDRTQPPD